MPISNQDLRKAGLKVTLPRIKILELLENSKQHHLSAEDIYKTLLEQGVDLGGRSIIKKKKGHHDRWTRRETPQHV